MRRLLTEMSQSLEMLTFLKNKDTRGWKATKLELEEFKSILDKHPASAKAKDEDNWTPLHHLAGRTLHATEHHVQMLALLMQRVPECTIQKDLRGKLPQHLVQESAATFSPWRKWVASPVFGDF